MIDLNSSICGDVVHVENQHKRLSHFHKLDRQVKVSFQVGRVGNINDEVGGFTKNKASGHSFFFRIGRQTIGSGKVHHFDGVSVFYKRPAFSFRRSLPDSYPRVVGRPSAH